MHLGDSITKSAIWGLALTMDMGSFADYAVTRESKIARKPANVTVDQAAAVPMCEVTPSWP